MVDLLFKRVSIYNGAMFGDSYTTQYTTICNNEEVNFFSRNYLSAFDYDNRTVYLRPSGNSMTFSIVDGNETIGVYKRSSWTHKAPKIVFNDGREYVIKENRAWFGKQKYNFQIRCGDELLEYRYAWCKGDLQVHIKLEGNHLLIAMIGLLFIELRLKEQDSW